MSDTAASAVLDLESERRQPPCDGAVELRAVRIGVVDRAGVVIAQVGENLRAGLDRVDVVAVELLGLIAAGAVVGGETLLYLHDDVLVLALEELQLGFDHAREPAAPEHSGELPVEVDVLCGCCLPR